MDNTKSLIDEIRRLYNESNEICQKLSNENLMLNMLVQKLTKENEDLKKENTNLYNKLFPESNKLAFPVEKL